MFTDSHCHFQLMEHPHGLEASLEACRKAGVTRWLCVSVGLQDLERLPPILALDSQLYGSMGIHPSETHRAPWTSDLFKEALAHEQVIAIGETGLDYYHDGQTHAACQQDSFARHIALAKEVQKPLIIHTREAKEDTIALMRSEGARDISGVMHCFTEDWSMAKAALDLGFYISFSGIVTFKNAHQVKEVAEKVPKDRLLYETDAPYLAPVPYRGKPNTPEYLPHTVEYLAGLRKMPQEQFVAEVEANFERLFLPAVYNA